MINLILDTSSTGTPSMVLDPKKMVIVFIIWIVLLVNSFRLIKKKQFTKKISLSFLIINIIVLGIAFSALPNPVMPIQQISSSVGMISNPQFNISTILPFIVILIVLLLTSLFIGRLFCGHACPLGAVQELASKIRFKSDSKSVNKRPNNKVISLKYSKAIRASFTLLFIVLLILNGVAFAQYLNPFLGFQLFQNPKVAMFVIPAIYLGIIVFVSIFVYRPWCRFFCPFGAIVSEIAKKSKNQLIRNDNCIDCGLCEKACPTNQSKRGDGKSECYLCMRCVDICPKDAIDFKKL